jgi:hypothetical protein
MFYSINLLIGTIPIKRIHPYIHREIKAEVSDRTLDESLFIDRSVNSENQVLMKYHFEISGIDDDQMINIQFAAIGAGNFYLIDYYQIPESLSGDGVTATWTLRRIPVAIYLPVISVDGVAQTVTMTSAINPGANNVFINATTGVMTFGTIPLDAVDNIKVKYVPNYPIHIVSPWLPESREAGLISYKLICEEI